MLASLLEISLSIACSVFNPLLISYICCNCCSVLETTFLLSPVYFRNSSKTSNLEPCVVANLFNDPCDRSCFILSNNTDEMSTYFLSPINLINCIFKCSPELITFRRTGHTWLCLFLSFQVLLVRTIPLCESQEINWSSVCPISWQWLASLDCFSCTGWLIRVY